MKSFRWDWATIVRTSLKMESEVWRNGPVVKRSLAVLAENMSLVPSTLMVAHNCNSRNLTPSPGFHRVHETCIWCTHMYAGETQHIPCKSCFDPSIMEVPGIEPGCQAWQQALDPLSRLASPSLQFLMSVCMRVTVHMWRQQAALGVRDVRSADEQALYRLHGSHHFLLS